MEGAVPAAVQEGLAVSPVKEPVSVVGELDLRARVERTPAVEPAAGGSGAVEVVLDPSLSWLVLA
ncbi:MAG: hypothetical protein G01um101438_746 [Parcubacteria group bacterium Gr01-1014_38]|nr:MAG: hypothetical protein G01um101438_746 [Parcubacteria group bacterium Gr01-1014_38]